jgi:hypothetical protein
MYRSILKQFFKRVVFLSESANGFLEHTDIIHITTMLAGIARRVPTMFVEERDIKWFDSDQEILAKHVRLLLFTNVSSCNPADIYAILEKCPNLVICILSLVPLDQLDVNKFSAFQAPKEDGWSGFFADLGMEKQEEDMLCQVLEWVAHLYLAPGLVNFLETHDGGILATYKDIRSLETEAGDLFVQFLSEEIQPYKNYFYDQELRKSNDFIGREEPPIGMESFKKWLKEYARVAKLILVETQTNKGEAFRLLPMRLK